MNADEQARLIHVHPSGICRIPALKLVMTTSFYEDVLVTVGVPNIKLARECACKTLVSQVRNMPRVAWFEDSSAVCWLTFHPGISFVSKSEQQGAA